MNKSLSETSNDLHAKLRTPKPYQLDLSAIKTKLFNLVNLFLSHTNIVSSNDKSLLIEWMNLLDTEVSKNLLEIAITMRALSDIHQLKEFKQIDKQLISYQEGLKDHHYCLREICNKIIHAIEIAFPIHRVEFSDINCEIDDEIFEDDDYDFLSALAPLVEMDGQNHNEKWHLTIDIVRFVSKSFEILKTISPSTNRGYKININPNKNVFHLVPT